MDYITLVEAKRYIGITETTEDTRLADFIAWATGFIDDYKGRRFDVRVETRLYDTPTASASMFGVFDARLQPAAAIPPLRLGDDLLELITLTNGDGDVIASPYLEPANAYPKTRIRLGSSDVWQANADGEIIQAVSVKGFWGFHDRYDQAFRASGATLSAGINDSVTAIAVSSISPFSPGQLLRIGDELLLVSAAAVILTVPTLTVERGYNGSTAASHLNAASVLVYHPPLKIVQSAARLVKWRFSQKDVDAFDKVYNADTGQTIIASAIPTDVLRTLGAPKAYL